MNIKKIKKTGELTINYNREFSGSKNNYILLKNMISGWVHITIAVDTNQRALKRNVDLIEEYLLKAGIKHKVITIGTNDSVFFGFKVGLPRDKRTEEKLIIMDIQCEQFNEELFDIIKNYDIAIGLGRKKTYEEICEALTRSVSEVLFNKYFFEGSIYDSVICSSLRCSSNVNNIEAIINEMDL